MSTIAARQVVNPRRGVMMRSGARRRANERPAVFLCQMTLFLWGDVTPKEALGAFRAFRHWIAAASVASRCTSEAGSGVQGADGYYAKSGQGNLLWARGHRGDRPLAPAGPLILFQANSTRSGTIPPGSLSTQTHSLMQGFRHNSVFALHTVRVCSWVESTYLTAATVT
jgi:hypothetical protein